MRARAAPSLWLAAFGIPLFALAAAVAIAVMQNIPFETKPPNWSDLLNRFVFTLLFIGLGEEPAWRGFLQPLLQRQLTPLVAFAFVPGHDLHQFWSIYAGVWVAIALALVILTLGRLGAEKT